MTSLSTNTKLQLCNKKANLLITCKVKSRQGHSQNTCEKKYESQKILLLMNTLTKIPFLHIHSTPQIFIFYIKNLLTLSWRRPLSYRNQQINGLVLYDNGLRHERVKWLLIGNVSIYSNIHVCGTMPMFSYNTSKRYIDFIILVFLGIILTIQRKPWDRFSNLQLNFILAKRAIYNHSIIYQHRP